MSNRQEYILLTGLSHPLAFVGVSAVYILAGGVLLLGIWIISPFLFDAPLEHYQDMARTYYVPFMDITCPFLLALGFEEGIRDYLTTGQVFSAFIRMCTIGIGGQLATFFGMPAALSLGALLDSYN